MKKGKSKLNSKDAVIVMKLHQQGGAMSINEVAEKTGISFVTAKNHLEDLRKKGIVFELGKPEKSKYEGKKSKTKRYSLNYSLINSVN